MSDRISLKQLRYFEAVARLGHFGRAAEACGVSQPALSMRVRELEDAVGAPLIERTPRGALLTDAGRVAAERARDVLDAAQDLVAAAAAVGARESERFGAALRLGVIPTIAPYLLPSLIARLRGVDPDLALHVRESRTKTLVRELLDGALDAALVALPIEGEGLETEVFFDDPFLLAAPTGDATCDAGAARVDPGALAGARLLLLEEGHCFRDQTLGVDSLRAACVVDSFGASSLSTLAQMCANGLGVTLLPAISAAVEARRADITLRRLPEPEPSRSVGLAWRRGSPRREAFRRLGVMTTRIAAEVIEEGRRP